MNRHPRDQQRSYPEGASRTQMDHFTDKIDNVLEEELGQRVFRHFMRECNMIDGLKKFEFWIQCKMLLYVKSKARIGELIEEADGVKELHIQNIQKLQIANDSGNEKQIRTSLEKIKKETRSALKPEYQEFKKNYSQK